MPPVKFNKSIISALCVCAAFGSGPALAEDTAENSTHWSVGLGGAIFTSPFKGVDDIVTALPYIAYEGEKLSVNNMGISYKFMGDENFSISAIAAPRFQLAEPKDSPVLTGMAKRKSTLEVGFSASYTTEFGRFALDAQTDALSVHKGSQVSFNYGIPFEVGKLGVVPTVSVAWQDSKLADYYYGVRVNEAIAVTRPKYVVDDVIIPSVGLNFRYPIKDNIDFVGAASYEFLPKEITNNKIINEKYTASAIVGVVYKF